MGKFFLSALFLLTAVTIRAQELKNIADLDYLYKSIQALPSYRDQLKNNKDYAQLYQRLRKDLAADDDFEVYQKLLQLIYPVKDNHLGFSINPDANIKFNYLKPPFNLKEIEARYKAYPVDSLEGFYYSKDGSTRYLVFRQSETTYFIQNLTSGLVEVILNKTGFQSLDAIRFLNPPVPYLLYRNVRISNGVLVGLPFQKSLSNNYAVLNPGISKYEYKELEHGLGYLRLSSFNSSNENIKIATDFFNKVKSDITAQHLIVDLRNNQGGGYKTSRQFSAFLNRFKGRIYILQNSSTMSNAEQFIIDIKDKKNVTTLGETTRGTITYGSNYGKAVVLPSNRFLFYPTDMQGRAKDLVFESTGVKPEVVLDAFSQDWILYTIKYIKANHP